MNTYFTKDNSDNTSLHYAYMMDLPEVRELLRDAKLANTNKTWLNRRGQLPSKMRHSSKAEDSEAEDDEDDAQAEPEAVEEDNDSMLVEELLAGKENYDLKDSSDNFRLLYNKQMSRKQKLAHY